MPSHSHDALRELRASLLRRVSRETLDPDVRVHLVAALQRLDDLLEGVAHEPHHALEDVSRLINQAFTAAYAKRVHPRS